MKQIEKNDRKLNDILKVFMQQDHIKPQLYKQRIQQAWQEMMGKTINQHTVSIDLRDRVLLIRVSSSSLKQELHFARNAMLENFNNFLKEPYLREIRILS